MQTRMKLPSLKMHKRLLKPNFIGSTIGIFEGCMPCAGGTIASFMSYNEARRWAKHPEEFGKCSPEAVAAPEAPNNNHPGTPLVPHLNFRLPGSTWTAVVVGGLLIPGLNHAPTL